MFKINDNYLKTQCTEKLQILHMLFEDSLLLEKGDAFCSAIPCEHCPLNLRAPKEPINVCMNMVESNNLIMEKNKQLIIGILLDKIKNILEEKGETLFERKVVMESKGLVE